MRIIEHTEVQRPRGRVLAARALLSIATVFFCCAFGCSPSDDSLAASGGATSTPTGGSASGEAAPNGPGGNFTAGSSGGGAAGTLNGASAGGVLNGGASAGGALNGDASTAGRAAAEATNLGGNSSGGALAGAGSTNGGEANASAGSAGAGTSSGGNASGGTDAGGTDSGLAAPPALTASVTVHVAGDSTAAVFPSTDNRVGWAAVLQQFFASGVVVDDAALSGRSSKSYIDEGAWSTLQAKLQTGDYLFIEFGHNDEKAEDPTRFTDPATTYRANLELFISGARSKGAYPVLLSSICRRYFTGSAVTGTHGAYTTAVFAVGTENRVPVIDLESKTKAWLTTLGPTASIPMFAPDDETHLSALGAPEVAELAVAGIREFGFPLATRLKP